MTDLLTREEYSKASGMVSVAESARYLISPVIAGFLLAVSDIKLLLLIDICTFFLTAVCTAIVRAGLASKTAGNTTTLVESFKEGWNAVTRKRGVIILVASSVTASWYDPDPVGADDSDFTDSRFLASLKPYVHAECLYRVYL